MPRTILSAKTDVYDELIDRFGEPPAAVCGLVDVALLRNMAADVFLGQAAFCRCGRCRSLRAVR